MKLIRRLLLLIIIAAVAIYVYNTSGSKFLAKQSPQAKKIVDNVLGTATKYTAKQASSSAALLDKFVFKQTSKPFIDQFIKLPKEKQEEIRKQICK